MKEGMQHKIVKYDLPTWLFPPWAVCSSSEWDLSRESESCHRPCASDADSTSGRRTPAKSSYSEYFDDIACL